MNKHYSDKLIPLDSAYFLNISEMYDIGVLTKLCLIHSIYNIFFLLQISESDRFGDVTTIRLSIQC